MRAPVSCASPPMKFSALRARPSRSGWRRPRRRSGQACHRGLPSDSRYFTIRCCPPCRRAAAPPRPDAARCFEQSSGRAAERATSSARRRSFAIRPIAKPELNVRGSTLFGYFVIRAGVAAGGGVEDVDHRLRVEPEALAGNHRFRGDGEVRRREDSCSAPSSRGPCPEPPVRNTLPIGSSTGRTRSAGAASPPDHDGERAVDRLVHAAGDRRVDQRNAELRKIRVQLARADRRGRAHVDDDGARGELRREPFAPSSTSRTILPSGSIVMTTRHGWPRLVESSSRARIGDLAPRIARASPATASATTSSVARARPAGAPSARPCCPRPMKPMRSRQERSASARYFALPAASRQSPWTRPGSCRPRRARRSRSPSGSALRRSAAGVRPLFSAPRMWVSTSCVRPSAVSMARLIMLRSLRVRPSRAQAAAPAELVQQLLQRAVEVGDVVHGRVDVFVAQHFAADRKPAFSAGLFGCRRSFGANLRALGFAGKGRRHSTRGCLLGGLARGVAPYLGVWVLDGESSLARRVTVELLCRGAVARSSPPGPGCSVSRGNRTLEARAFYARARPRGRRRTRGCGARRRTSSELALARERVAARPPAGRPIGS